MPWGRIGAADRRNPGDNKDSKTTNLEVSGRFATMYLARETPGVRFHTAEITERGSSGWTWGVASGVLVGDSEQAASPLDDLAAVATSDPVHPLAKVRRPV
jgi:hypothetical protein